MRATVDPVPQLAQVAQVAQRVQQAPMAVVETVVQVARPAKRAMGGTVRQVMPAHPMVARVVRVVTQARMPGWVAPQVRLVRDLAIQPVQALRVPPDLMSLRVATEVMAGLVTPIHRVMAVTVVLVVWVALWATEEPVGPVDLALQQARALLRRVAKVVLVVTVAQQEMVVRVVRAVQPVQRAQMHKLRVVPVEMVVPVLLC